MERPCPLAGGEAVLISAAVAHVLPHVRTSAPGPHLESETLVSATFFTTDLLLTEVHVLSEEGPRYGVVTTRPIIAVERHGGRDHLYYAGPQGSVLPVGAVPRPFLVWTPRETADGAPMTEERAAIRALTGRYVPQAEAEALMVERGLK